MALKTVARYSQCRSFNHIYLFKTKTDQSLILKIFDLAQKKLITIAAYPPDLSKRSIIENGEDLLSLFIQNNLIPAEFKPRTPTFNGVHELQQLILLAKSKVSVETENKRQFTCPITLDILEDPVMDEHGDTYERSAITKWLLEHQGISPLNRLPINTLTPNKNLKEEIDRLKQQNPIPIFVRSEKQNPVLFGQHLKTARICIKQKVYDEALVSYSNAFKYTNDWRDYVELPKLFEAMASPEKATLAYLYLALYQLQDGEFTQALKTLENCKKNTLLSQQIDKFLIPLYHANKQTDKAIQIALLYSRTFTDNPQEVIQLNKQILMFDPCQWNVYLNLIRFLTNPQEKAHILIKGACHALDVNQYSIAQGLSKQAEKLYANSFLDRLIELECISIESSFSLKKRLLNLAQAYEQNDLFPAMVKAYKMLVRLEYNPSHYQKILEHVSGDSKTRWTLAFLSAVIDDKDWEFAESVAKSALKLTNEPIPILCHLETVYTNWNGHKLNTLLNELGSAYFRTNQLDLAEKTYRKAYEKLQSLENALALGHTLKKQVKLHESVQAYYDASIFALLSENVEVLDLCLGNIRQIDPYMVCFTQAQKVHVITQSQIIKLSTELKNTRAELKQTQDKLTQTDLELKKVQEDLSSQLPKAPSK